MKRLLAIILAVCHLCLSVGITVHTHYCMGKMVGTSFIEPEEDHHCSYCGMDKKSGDNGCCKDEHKVIKSVTDQLTVKNVSTEFHFFDIILPTHTPQHYSSARLDYYISWNTCSAHAPPLIIPSCPIYILTRNLRV